MTFSKEWEELYLNQEHLSIWPWSDVVSLVMKYKNPVNDKLKVLELGCGAGANIPFFLHYGCEYYAIEGSKSIVKKLKKSFKNIESNIVVEDFTKEISFNNQFDIILDRGSLTHNSTTDIRNALNIIYNKLNENGIYIGVDWFSVDFSEYKNGTQLEDIYTIGNLKSGRLDGTGIAHFSDKDHLLELFQKYKILSLEHKKIKNYYLDENDVYAAWNIVATK